jgi:acyl carrier protein
MTPASTPDPPADVKESVRRFLLDEFLPGEDPASLGDATPLITGGILDSIATLKLVSFLESRFGVGFDAYELSPDHLDTIAQIVRTVEAKRAAKR